MSQLTVLIPCKDERENIAACIASVRDLADEILVADSGSTDGTQDIVRRLGGCRLIEREFVSYADFKNWAIPQAMNDWVLVVDADERMTDDLADEIRQILAAEPARDAYALRRQNFFLGQPIRHCGWNHSYVTRLLRRSACRYRLCRVHEEIDLAAERIGRLGERLLHYTCTDFDKFLFKQVKYSLYSAEDRFERQSRVGLFTLLSHGPLRFVQLYLLRGGCLDGLAGLVICTLMAYYAFLKDAKLWSLHVASESGQTPQLSQKTHVTAKAA